MLWTFVILNILDLVTTYVGVVRLGMIEENSIMRYVLFQHGFAGLIVAKGLLVCYILCSCALFARRCMPWLKLYQRLMVGIYIVLVASNLKCLILR